MVLYDSAGRAVAYSDDGEHIYSYGGQPVAYLHGGSLYDYNGRHLGRFDDGWVRDNGGGAVFFTEESHGGPLKPLKGLAPLKSLKQLKPLKSLRELAPIRPINSLSWSEVSGEQFFGQ